MKRIAIYLLMISGITCYGQEKTGLIYINGDYYNNYDEYFEGYQMPDELVRLAKSIWWHFPKADKVNYNYKGRLIVNENGLEFRLLIPTDSLSSSLKDSIEMILSREQVHATIASVTRDIGQNGDSLSYTLAWVHGRQQQGVSTVTERQPGSVPSIYGFAVVTFDVFNRHAFFSSRFDNIKAHFGLEEPQQKVYDVTGLDDLLNGLKRQYKTKKKKVIFTADDNWSTGIGYEYVLDCDAEKVYDTIRSYVGHEYLMKHTPLVSFKYYYDTDMMTITLFKLVNEQDGGRTQNKQQDREIQICSRNGKLLIIDITNQNDRNAPCSIFSLWDALLEGQDDHYLLPGKITTKGNKTTLQVRDKMYRMKHKNRFSSTYRFEQGL